MDPKVVRLLKNMQVQSWFSCGDVDEAIANLLRERSRLAPHQGAPALGDMIVADLRVLNGDTLLSQASELSIVVRPTLSFADAELKGFDALVKSAAVGSKVSAPVTVSSEAAVEDLRGKKVTVELTVLEIKKLEMPELWRV